MPKASRTRATQQVTWRPLVILLFIIGFGAYGVYRLDASQAATIANVPNVSAAASISLDAVTSVTDPRFVADPTASIAPDTNFRKACFWRHPKPDCTQLALAAINRVRLDEGLDTIELPSDFAERSVAEQSLVITNAERQDRGLPPFAGPDETLNQLAQAGAQAQNRPTGPEGHSWGANWAGNVVSPVAAHYLWMYDDGPNSTNRSCTDNDPAGCWGHRHNILSPWGGSMGVATDTVEGQPSMAQLFVKNWP